MMHTIIVVSTKGSELARSRSKIDNIRRLLDR